MELACSSCSTPSQFKCHEQAYCASCVTRHISLDMSSTHILINPLDKPESFCSLCEGQASLKCRCSAVPTFLCSLCLSIHTESSGLKSHPIELIWSSEIPQTSTELIETLVKIEFGKKIIKENLKYLTLYDQKVQNEYLKLQQSINNHYDCIEDEIEKAENYLNSLSTELEECKRNSDSSEIGFMQKNNFQINKGKGIKLFDGNIDDDSCIGHLKNFANLVIKGESNSTDQRIYMIKPRSKEIVILDPSTKAITKRSLGKLALKDTGTWCDLPNRRLFYCGGVQGPNFSNEAYTIDPKDMSYQVHPTMHKSRALSSVIYYRGKVYVFGGYSGINLSSCECFDLHSKDWKMISDMPIARSAFSVTEFKGFFYMTGDSTSIDKYDPKNDCYQTFVNVLPAPCSYSTIAVYENSLFIQQTNSCIEVDIEKLKIKDTYPTPQGRWWSFFPAKVIDGQIVFSRYDDAGIWTFNVKSKNINKIKV